MTADVTVLGMARWRGSEGKTKPALLPPMLRRRTSALTRSVAEVLGRLQESTGVEVAHVPLVLGSSMGELGTTLQLLEMMHSGDGALSPTRFHNSVHNTAVGYVSIATGNRGLATAISAGDETPAMTLLETIGVIRAGATEAILVLAEEPPPEPLPMAGSYEALAVALHLGTPPGGAGHLRLDAPRLRSVPTVLSVDATLAQNPCAGGWALADAVSAGRPGPVALQDGPAGASTWSTELVEIA